jgi:hypothetical protein
MIMSSHPTVIYSAANTQQAHLLKGLLIEQGIAAWVVNDAIQMAGGDLPLGWAAAARVVVAEQDAAQARQLAEEFDRQTAHEPTDDGGAERGDLGDWPDWPTCPACGERRSARCPVCGATGTSFPVADVQESSSGKRVFLHCPDCDDHILPEWYRVCARCGHDYGEGVEVVSPTEPEAVETSVRGWIVLGLAIAGSLALVGYFVWLFNLRS